MSSFKACSVSDGDDLGCRYLMDNLNRSGHPDYALAVAVYAPNCHQACRELSGFVTNVSGEVQLTLVRDIVLTSRTEIVSVLERSCHIDGYKQACQWYAQVGGSYNEAERQEAVDAMKASYNQSAANSDNQINRAENSSPGFLSTLAGALTNVQQTTPTIQETAAQNQADLQAAAVAAQQRQQAQEQTRIAAEQSARAAQATATNVPSIPSNTIASSGSVQASCTDMTGSVQGSVKVGTDGWVIGYLTNNSAETLYVSYTFKQNGVPSNAMANAGGTTIQAGQTVGGEGQGLYSTGADKNPPQIYWYAVLKSEHDRYGCAHKW